VLSLLRDGQELSYKPATLIGDLHCFAVGESFFVVNLRHFSKRGLRQLT